MINVTKTFLPPLEEYVSYLERIWSSGQVTNNGPLVRELEARLGDYLGAKHVIVTANGTLALQLAIKSLGLKGKIITTPFSYVATVGAILAEGCEPVFVDIRGRDLSIDPDLIEEAITPEVSAILPVHVFGLPCATDTISAISRAHGIKVIFDAAHAFGAELRGKSLATFGDASALSFHATKLFHTVEGGAVVTDNDDLAERIRLMRAFGHRYDDHYCAGINAKSSEFHAAMGLCLLPKVPQLISRRRRAVEAYEALLCRLPLERPETLEPGYASNYAYFPVLFDSEESLLKAKSEMEVGLVFPRRYFYPSLNELPYCSGQRCRVSEDIARRILCLPLFPELSAAEQDQICSIIERALS